MASLTDDNAADGKTGSAVGSVSGRMGTGPAMQPGGIDMKAKRDYYEILGIQKNADGAAIKKAYRNLAKRYHPDTNPGNAQAEQRFKEVTEAFTVLSDEEKRKIYDRFGHAGLDGSAAQAGAYGENQGGYREYHYSGGDMDDIFGDIFGDFFRDKRNGGFQEDGYYRGFHGGGFGGYAGEDLRRQGSDLNAEIAITFEEAVFGCDKVISLRSPEEAGGAVRSLQVHIPAGIESGRSIRLRGKGMPGRNGGEPGDLLLKVTVHAKPGFERKGMDIYTTVSIPFTTAVFGGEVTVRTIHGNVLCKIKEGTQSGSRIRLKGKGVVSMKDPAVYGDHYITVQIQVPGNLSQEARQKLKEFEALCGQNRRNGKGSAA